MSQFYDSQSPTNRFVDPPIEVLRPGSAPDVTLHPLRGVVWASLLGSPIAAGVVIGLNYWQVGRRTAALLAGAIGLVATALLIGGMLAIPEELVDKIPSVLIYGPQLLVVFFVAKALQGEMIEHHEKQGGMLASAWPSIGIGVLCGVLAAAIILAGVAAYDASMGELVEFGNDEIYLQDAATRQDAELLAKLLREEDMFWR